jgi:hypothetical protein
VTEIRDCLLPHLTPHSVAGKLLYVLGKTVRVDTFDGADDTRVQYPAPVLEDASVGDLVGKRVLEGVLKIREKARLVQKLGRLEMAEAPAQCVRRHVRNRLQEREGHTSTRCSATFNSTDRTVHGSSSPSRWR